MPRITFRMQPYMAMLLLVMNFVPEIGSSQDSYKAVRAEQGDGIYSILRKQGLNPSQYINQFIELNQDLLVNGNQLIVGRQYRIPSGKTVSQETNNQSATIGNKEIIKIDDAGETGAKKDDVTEAITEKEDAVEKKVVETSKKDSNESGTTYPIFGSDMASVTPKSSRLDGTVYYLISGHGGPDPGAMETYNGTAIAEDEYAYDVTLRLARELLAHGAKVYVIVRDENDGIRDDRILAMDQDEVVYPDKEIPLDQLERLKQRVDVVNDLYLRNTGKYQRLLVTHVDSRSRSQNIDVFFYYHEKSKNGRRLAESIHTTFQKKYKKFQPYRDYTGTFTDRSNLYMVKNTLPAMAYIEIGNIRNGKDKRRILNPDNRQAVAKWISEGVILDYEMR